MRYSRAKLYALQEAEIRELQMIYSNTQTRLQTIVSTIDNTSFAKWRAKQLRGQVDSAINTLSRKSIPLVRQGIKNVYGFSSQLSVEGLRRQGARGRVDMGNRLNTQTISSLAQQTAIDLVNANESTRRDLHRFIRQTQQGLIQDHAISRLLAEGVALGETGQTIASQLALVLREKMLGGNFLTINGRNYQIDKYAKLVIRTRLKEASVNASINVNIAFGNDLVQVTTVSTACEICIPIQGKIYSISGNDPNFPPYRSIHIPVHPNCWHDDIGVIEEALRMRGRYYKMSRFSKSKRTVASPEEYQELVKFKPRKKKVA